MFQQRYSSIQYRSELRCRALVPRSVAWSVSQRLSQGSERPAAWSTQQFQPLRDLQKLEGLRSPWCLCSLQYRELLLQVLLDMHQRFCSSADARIEHESHWSPAKLRHTRT